MDLLSREKFLKWIMSIELIEVEDDKWKARKRGNYEMEDGFSNWGLDLERESCGGQWWWFARQWIERKKMVIDVGLELGRERKLWRWEVEDWDDKVWR